MVKLKEAPAPLSESPRHSSGFQHIYRHETTKTCGWEVVFRRGIYVIGAHFADSCFGGREKALKMARAARDVIHAMLPASSPVKFRNSLNTSGTIGVGKTMEKTRSGREILYYYAGWVEDGRTKRRKFSTEKYGEEQAKEMAIAARKEALEAIGAAESLKAYLQQIEATLPIQNVAFHVRRS